VLVIGFWVFKVSDVFARERIIEASVRSGWGLEENDKIVRLVL
jgi:hypothetical protein